MNQFEELPIGWTNVELTELGIGRTEGIIPAVFSEEIFELWSVPAFVTGNPEIITGSEIGSSKQIVKHGDVLLCKINPRINRVWKVGIKTQYTQIASTEWIIFRANQINSDFLVYYFQEKSFRDALCAEVSGVGGSLIRARPQAVAKLQIPLAPLNEQRRIVAKIEALKAKSQRVKEALEDIPQLLDQFRQSVLAAAFRGDLTADWREQNSNVEPASVLLERIRAERRRRWEEAELEKMKASGKLPKDNKWKEKYIEPEPIDISNLLELPQGWKWATMDEIADIDLGKMLDRGKEQRGKFLPYLRNINVRWGYFDLSDLLEMDFVEDEIERFSLKKDDILVCEGGQPGRAAVWELDKSDIKYQKTLHRVRPFCKIHPFWFVYHLKLDATTGRLENYFSGSTIKHFTKVAFQRYAVRLTSIEEQKEIILRIHSLFKTADVIQQQYQEIKANLDQLDQSILAKAFRGELVPQDPNDEPASVLLERIRAERGKLQTKAANKSTPPIGGRRSKKASQQEAEPVQLELGLE